MVKQKSASPFSAMAFWPISVTTIHDAGTETDGMGRSR
jgi:hypothetical protein